MSILLGAVKQTNTNAIQKRVDEINAMIRFAKLHKLEVVDKSGSWQSPMIYEQLKYTKGVLYAKYKELDLYKANRGGGRDYKNMTERYGKNDVKEGLTYIARMYRARINQFKKYGY